MDKEILQTLETASEDVERSIKETLEDYEPTLEYALAETICKDIIMKIDSQFRAHNHLVFNYLPQYARQSLQEKITHLLFENYDIKVKGDR